MKFRSRKVHELDVDGMTAELSLEPSPVMSYVDHVIERASGLLAVGYLVDDTDVSNPLEDCDGMGSVYSSHRFSGQHYEMQDALGLDSDWGRNYSLVERQAEKLLMDLVNSEYKTDMVAYLIEAANSELGSEEAIQHFLQDFSGQLPYHKETWLTLKVNEKTNWEALLERAWHQGREAGTVGDPYAVMLDCYEHGGQVWSLSGQGMQCLFDTARGAGVWVPDSCLREELDSIRTNDGLEAARHKAREFAGQALESYNAWLAGDCYGVAVDVYSVEGERLKLVDDSAVYGHIGKKWAEEAMRDEVRGMLEAAGRKAA